MKKFTATEWQSFSLKKDIEGIKMELKKNRTTQIFTLIQIALAIVAIFVQIILQNPPCFIQVILYSILALSCLIPLFVYILSFKKPKETRPKDQMNPVEFIDSFDNEIVYYTLISESYCTMLEEALSKKEPHPSIDYKNMIHFYYIQASYYFQKTITDLSFISNIATEVLSFDIGKIVDYKLISLPRYENVKNLLETIYDYLESKKSLHKGLDLDITAKLNQEFYDTLKAINRAVLKGLRPEA